MTEIIQPTAEAVSTGDAVTNDPALPEWVSGLVEEAKRCPASEKGLCFVSPWGGFEPHAQSPDLERHKAYVAPIRETLEKSVPWLLPLVSDAGGSVAVAPGVFSFLCGAPDTVREYPAPELVPLTKLAPFHVPGEVAH